MRHGQEGWALGAGATQAEHGKWYLGVIDRGIDKAAQRADTCPALVLLRLIININVSCLLFENYMIKSGSIIQ